MSQLNTAPTAPVVGIQDAKRRQLLAAIDRLPQRAVLQPVHIERWVDAVLKNDPERAMWHVRRLSGIGGSEIGPLVAAARGTYSIMGSAYDTVAEKLLMFPPKKPSAIMRRGTDFEDWVVRPMFERDYGAKSCKTDLEVLRGKCHPQIPWMVGSPDDIVMIGSKRFLADYKSPNEETIEGYERKGGISLEYCCQVHQYYLIGQGNNHVFDGGMLLVSYDFRKHELDVRQIKYDPKLVTEMIAVGNHVWNEYVMRGELPPKRVLDPVEPPAAIAEDVQHLAGQLVLTKCIENAAKETSAALSLQLLDITETVSLGANKMAVGAINISEKSVIDEEEVELRLERHEKSIEEFTARTGINEEALGKLLAEHPEVGDLLAKFECYESGADYEAAITALAGLGEDVSGCYRPVQSIRMSGKKTGPEAEMVQQATQAAREALGDPIQADVNKLITDFNARVAEQVAAAEKKALEKAAKKPRKGASADATAAAGSQPNPTAQGGNPAGIPDPAAEVAAAPKPRRSRAVG